MHLLDVVAKIKARSCVLFLGAAVHAAPPADLDQNWPAAERPPIGATLSSRLAARSGFAERRPDEDPKNLLRVSLDYEIKMQRSALIEAVRDEVQKGKCGSPLLKSLARMDFPVVITTNFDTHFEDALYEVGKRPFVSVYKNNVEASERTDEYPSLFPTPKEPFILKIHGDIQRNPGSIVITEEDYIQFVLRMSDKGPYDPIPEVARAYLAKCTTLFLGYSLRDYNLRLLFKSLRWRIDTAPQTYSVDFRPDPLVQEVLERRTGKVSYIVQDVWKFVPAIASAILPAEASA
jgi:SIR2-like domain